MWTASSAKLDDRATRRRRSSRPRRTRCRARGRPARRAARSRRGSRSGPSRTRSPRHAAVVRLDARSAAARTPPIAVLDEDLRDAARPVGLRPGSSSSSPRRSPPSGPLHHVADLDERLRARAAARGRRCRPAAPTMGMPAVEARGAPASAAAPPGRGRPRRRQRPRATAPAATPRSISILRVAGLHREAAARCVPSSRLTRSRASPRRTRMQSLVRGLVSAHGILLLEFRQDRLRPGCAEHAEPLVALRSELVAGSAGTARARQLDDRRLEVAAAAAGGSVCAPPSGSGTTASMTPSRSRSGAGHAQRRGRARAPAAASLNRMVEQPSGLITE